MMNPSARTLLAIVSNPTQKEIRFFIRINLTPQQPCCSEKELQKIHRQLSRQSSTPVVLTCLPLWCPAVTVGEDGLLVET